MAFFTAKLGLPLQSPPVQLVVIVSFPTQNLPPFEGDGFVQVRLLWCLHSGPQLDQVDQPDQRPSTAARREKNMINCSVSIFNCA